MENYYGYRARMSVDRDQIKKGWLVVISFIGMTVFLIILTVLFSLLYHQNHKNLRDIQSEYNNLTIVSEEYVDCCALIPGPNCTCFLPGAEVACWDASLNIPEVNSGVPPETEGILYVTCQSGNTEIDGKNEWMIGDYLLYVPEAGKWFQNKAASSGLLFQTFEIETICETNNADFFAIFEQTSITISNNTYWNILRGNRTNFEPSVPCKFTSAPLPNFLQADPLDAVFYTFLATGLNNEIEVSYSPESFEQLNSIQITDVLQISPFSWVDFDYEPPYFPNPEIVFEQAQYLYAT